ncbi:Phosphatidylinositol 3-kinase VPS34 [Frankliniella fusca]|uniref:Phosphatidylinositol 3-kinase VPS34 n=1 Tax=Frankliniella fusca TaxID=407009 RepID=A0AAE1HX72_9NEOP|nr:Phosphatidylinositol 3-kinase VPS34 [Frankliniella fusca]
MLMRQDSGNIHGSSRMTSVMALEQCVTTKNWRLKSASIKLTAAAEEHIPIILSPLQEMLLCISCIL